MESKTHTNQTAGGGLLDLLPFRLHIILPSTNPSTIMTGYPPSKFT